MKFFLYILVLLCLFAQFLLAQISSENSSVEVISSQWTKTRQKADKSKDQSIVPAKSAGDSINRNFERNSRVNDPMGKIDPNTQTIEGRSEALEKIVQESRTPKTDPSEGFIYQTKIRNAGKSTIEILFWEYQFTERANPANVASRQFLCGINVKPNKEKELIVFSTLSPSPSISINSLEINNATLFDEKVLINRVEYSDGTIWQRKDWNYSAMKSSINHALETPWGNEMCRNL